MLVKLKRDFSNIQRGIILQRNDLWKNSMFIIVDKIINLNMFTTIWICKEEKGFEADRYLCSFKYKNKSLTLEVHKYNCQFPIKRNKNKTFLCMEKLCDEFIDRLDIEDCTFLH